MSSLRWSGSVAWRCVEDDFRIVLCPGAAVIARVRKISPVPVAVQRSLLVIFSFTEDEFLAALPF